MPRPKNRSKRPVRLSVYISPQERAKLEKRAAKLGGVSLADVVRMMIAESKAA